MGLGETARTVIQDSGTLCLCLSPAKAICHSPLDNSPEHNDSKTAQREQKVMLKLCQFAELECCSAQKKTAIKKQLWE